MAINVNLPTSSQAHDDYHQTMGWFTQSTLAANAGIAFPASHQNILFDAMMGFKPHNFTPTDIANNPVMQH